MKFCAQCGDAKEPAEFNKHRGMPDGLQPRCRTCHQDDARQRYWQSKGVEFSNEEYVAMLAAQNGMCAICGGAETETGKSGDARRMPMDHCHQTKKVRALLCTPCNTGIGKLKTDPELLIKAANYILEHQKRHAEAPAAVAAPPHPKPKGGR